ncbi:agmatinase family protein [Acetobacteroides hydrogenigenes]|uniref:Agmatinase n=1 Tax=Acetobacteroides hydrogenigenes TaxID=979970 RepID=A0A4R2EFH3_9BACT|nr:agmatinase family protein [Acetobacteroides hydrogenigenes]TCN66737.1 agmatinase [Acetobacteroides hydrogenigenes]
MEFNPNGVGQPNGNYFALPYSPEEANVVLLSVPWDVTTSYAPGTADGPQAILNASPQLDLHDPFVKDAWKVGIGTLPIDEGWRDKSAELRELAEDVIERLENGEPEDSPAIVKHLKTINSASESLNDYVYAEAKNWTEKGKIVGVVGGEHSVPFGLIKALSEKHESLGILHIDAHCDLRVAYEGFNYSHASIMYNVLDKIPAVDRLVQVAVRDFSEEEISLAMSHPKIVPFTDFELCEEKFQGMSWHDQCEQIIEQLPKKVYISFDIDGLTPDCCPNTGTPVPGGLTFQEAIYLLKLIAESGRKIVGFDLVEVAPDDKGEWDANVGARMLYKLCNLAYKSNQ